MARSRKLRVVRPQSHEWATHPQQSAGYLSRVVYRHCAEPKTRVIVLVDGPGTIAIYSNGARREEQLWAIEQARAAVLGLLGPQVPYTPPPGS